MNNLLTLRYSEIEFNTFHSDFIVSKHPFSIKSGTNVLPSTSIFLLPFVLSIPSLLHKSYLFTELIAEALKVIRRDHAFHTSLDTIGNLSLFIMSKSS